MSEVSGTTEWSGTPTDGQEAPPEYEWALTTVAGSTVVVRSSENDKTWLSLRVRDTRLDVELRPLDCAMLAEALEERS